jgi:hypothetical protein
VISWEAQPRKASQVHLAAEVLEIRDTWLRFSSLEISSKDGLPRNTEEITASI